MPRRKRPVLGVDYIIDTDGKAQFTAEYLLKRGTCCEHECRYCPFPSQMAGQPAAQPCVPAPGAQAISSRPVQREMRA